MPRPARTFKNPHPIKSTGGGLSFPWAEYLGSSGPGQQSASMNFNQVQASLTIDIDYANWISGQAAAEILGYATAGGNGSITRKIPFQHPYFDDMWAEGIASVQPIRFDGRPGANKAKNAPHANFAIARLTITFSRRLYKVSGGNAAGEWNRYTIKLSKPRVEFVTLNKLQIVWPNGTPDASDGLVVWDLSGPTIGGQAVGASRGVRLPMNELTWKWVQVPEQVLDSSGNPVNITKGIGRVNTPAFAGYDPGTLLCTGCVVDAHPAPIVPDTVQGAPSVYYDLTITMLHFDPAGTVFQNSQDFRVRGHNIFPHPTNGLWYPGTSQAGRTAGRLDPLYRGYNFEDMFKAI